jgi:hypothetical protein
LLLAGSLDGRAAFAGPPGGSLSWSRDCDLDGQAGPASATLRFCPGDKTDALKPCPFPTPNNPRTLCYKGDPFVPSDRAPSNDYDEYHVRGVAWCDSKVVQWLPITSCLNRQNATQRFYLDCDNDGVRGDYQGSAGQFPAQQTLDRFIQVCVDEPEPSGITLFVERDPRTGQPVRVHTDKLDFARSSVLGEKNDDDPTVIAPFCVGTDRAIVPHGTIANRRGGPEGTASLFDQCVDGVWHYNQVDCDMCPELPELMP